MCPWPGVRGLYLARSEMYLARREVYLARSEGFVLGQERVYLNRSLGDVLCQCQGVHCTWPEVRGYLARNEGSTLSGVRGCTWPWGSTVHCDTERK
jgi:hypothetical protein